jgi:hypothetical protein
MRLAATVWWARARWRGSRAAVVFLALILGLAGQVLGLMPRPAPHHGDASDVLLTSIPTVGSVAFVADGTGVSLGRLPVRLERIAWSRSQGPTLRRPVTSSHIEVVSDAPGKRAGLWGTRLASDRSGLRNARGRAPGQVRTSRSSRLAGTGATVARGRGLPRAARASGRTGQVFGNLTVHARSRARRACDVHASRRFLAPVVAAGERQRLVHVSMNLRRARGLEMAQPLPTAHGGVRGWVTSRAPTSATRYATTGPVASWGRCSWRWRPSCAPRHRRDVPIAVGGPRTTVRIPGGTRDVSPSLWSSERGARAICRVRAVHDHRQCCWWYAEVPTRPA